MRQPIDFVIRASSDDLAKTLRDFIVGRLSFALRRFEHQVRRVKVRLIDLNGPKRGVDSRCSMTLELVHGGSIVVEATTARPFTSVTRAAGRLKEALRRELTRATSHA